MVYEYVDAESLKDHPQNPKRHTEQQIEKLKNSIARFGFLKNLVVDENNQILVGHGRRRATTGKVRVVRLAKLTEEQKKALLLADNMINLETGYEPRVFDQAMEVLRQNNYPLEEIGLLAEVLGETGERAKDENKLGESMKRYLAGETKRLVLYYEPEECESVESRIDRLMREEEVPMRCDLVVGMLVEYERNFGALE